MIQDWSAQLRKGLIELATLACLNAGQAYGYQLLQYLHTAANLPVTESTLYPLLARLTRQRLLTVRAAPSPHGPPRRYYRLTAAGRERLAQLTRQWQATRNSIDRLLSEESTHD